VESLDGAGAKRVGALLDRSAVNYGVTDASVAEGALRRGDAVVTSDPIDIRALAGAADRKLETIAI
jgi:hypothetical protein